MAIHTGQHVLKAGYKQKKIIFFMYMHGLHEKEITKQLLRYRSDLEIVWVVSRLREDAPKEVFNGKMEDFLTCLNLSSHLKKNYFGDEKSTLFEEISLNAIQKTLYTGLVTHDLMLLISEMPKILRLKYPDVGKIRELLVKIIPQVMGFLRTQNRWQELTNLEYKLEMLKIFKIN